MHCRAAEKLAVALGTSADLPSRLGSAMMHALAEAAASNGHTYMSWEGLQKQSLKLLRDSGMLYATTSRLRPFRRQTMFCHRYQVGCRQRCRLLLFGNFAVSCNCAYLTITNMCGPELYLVIRTCLQSESSGLNMAVCYIIQTTHRIATTGVSS